MRYEGCVLLQMFISVCNCICKGLQGGTVCGPVFCNFLKRVFKENSCFEEGIFIEIVAVWFVRANGADNDPPKLL